MALARALARGRIYYGWYIVGAVFLFTLVTSAMTMYAAPIFLKPMTQDLGMSRGFFSLSVTLGNLIFSPLALVVGPLVDRHGARWVMLIGGFTLGLGPILLGLVQTPWQFFVIKGVILPFGMLGVGRLASEVAVSNWFIKKRGRVMAILGIGVSAPGIIMPPLATFLIAALGWRQAWMVLGLASWALVLPSVALLIKRRPEDIGLLPDGETGSPRDRAGQPPPKLEVVWTRREALRAPAFWLLTLSIPFGMLGWAALLQHLYPFLTDIEFTPQAAAFMTATLSVASVSVKPAWGFLGEHVPTRYCFVVIFSLLGLGTALLPRVGPNWMALVLLMVFLGMAGGGLVTLQGLIWANYFGRLSLGQVRGLGIPIQAVLSPWGSIMAGFMWDVTGSYRSIFTAYLGTHGLAALLLFLAQPPKKKELALSVIR